MNFTTIKALNRRQVRWAELLGQYKFKIHYTLGKENGRADALSRRSNYIENKDSNERAILRQENDGSLVPNTQTLATIAKIEEPSMINKIIKAYNEDEQA